MNNEELIANLDGLMTSFHLEIKALPDDLKCAKCKSVLKNACQVSCSGRLCRTCIDDVISRGDQFCPGSSQECGATNLSTALPDYRANKRIWKLTAKCPHANCPHECSLADLEGHMRLCLRKTVDYPYSPFCSINSTLDGIKMSGHLLQENHGHSEILIGMVTNISRDMEILKRELLLKDEHMESDMKLIRDDIKSIKDEMKSVIIENKSIQEKNELIKEENKSIKNLIKAIKDEMKSIKIECESIKCQKEVLSDRVRQLTEKLERDIDEISPNVAPYMQPRYNIVGMPANQIIIMTGLPPQNTTQRRNIMVDPLMTQNRNARNVQMNQARSQYNIVANGRPTTINPMYQYPMQDGSGPQPMIGADQIKMTDMVESQIDLSTTSKIANADSMEARQLLGEKIYPLVSKHAGDMAGKITGMFLELDNAELLYMIDNENALRMKIDEALLVLNAHKSGEGERSGIHD